RRFPRQETLAPNDETISGALLLLPPLAHFRRDPHNFSTKSLNHVGDMNRIHECRVGIGLHRDGPFRAMAQFFPQSRFKFVPHYWLPVQIDLARMPDVNAHRPSPRICIRHGGLWFLPKYEKPVLRQWPEHRKDDQ